MKYRVLLLSAYAAGSHRAWVGSLQAMLPEMDFTVLSLPPRHFNWRLRGNALYWSQAEHTVLNAAYDRILATSMVDLATLRGLVPALARVPTLLYFHENQFAYPRNSRQQGEIEAQITTLYSALAADRLLFNSGWNRDSFFAGVGSLLQRLPDFVPPDITEQLGARSGLLPVPLSGDVFQTSPLGGKHPFSGAGSNRPDPARPLRIVWLGRFEYDKGAEQLLECLRSLLAGGVVFELALIGQRFRKEPAAFAAIRELLGERLVYHGYLDSREDYLASLSAADIALSTALHEFQGVAMLEATARGCLPCVPHSLVYPELYPSRFCYPVSAERDALSDGVSAAAKIQCLACGLVDGQLAAPPVDAYASRSLAPAYRKWLVNPLA